MAMQKKHQKQTVLKITEPSCVQDRYVDEPSCPEDCRDCERGMAEEVIAAENVEWARIAYGVS
jgi:hypothetical protein